MTGKASPAPIFFKYAIIFVQSLNVRSQWTWNSRNAKNEELMSNTLACEAQCAGDRRPSN